MLNCLRPQRALAPIGLVLAVTMSGAPTVAEAATRTIDVGNGEQDVTIVGASPDDGIHLPRALGDLNDDGVSDIVVGTYGGDGPSDSRESAGEIHILFGPLPPGGSFDLATTPADVTIYGAEAWDGVRSPYAADVSGAICSIASMQSPSTSISVSPDRILRRRSGRPCTPRW